MVLDMGFIKWAHIESNQKVVGYSHNFIFFFKNTYYPIIFVYHTFMIHLSFGEHIDFFYSLAILTRAAMNMDDGWLSISDWHQV